VLSSTTDDSEIDKNNFYFTVANTDNLRAIILGGDKDYPQNKDLNLQASIINLGECPLQGSFRYEW